MTPTNGWQYRRRSYVRALLVFGVVLMASGCLQPSAQSPMLRWSFLALQAELNEESYGNIDPDALIDGPIELRVFTQAKSFSILEATGPTTVSVFGIEFHDDRLISELLVSQSMGGYIGFVQHAEQPTLTFATWNHWERMAYRVLPTLFLGVSEGSLVSETQNITMGGVQFDIEWTKPGEARVSTSFRLVTAPFSVGRIEFLYEFPQVGDLLVPIPSRIEAGHVLTDSGEERPNVVWEFGDFEAGAPASPSLPASTFARHIADPGPNNRWPTPAAGMPFPFPVEEALAAARECRPTIDTCDRDVSAFLLQHGADLVMLGGHYEELETYVDRGSVSIVTDRIWDLVLQGDQEIMRMRIAQAALLGEAGQAIYAIRQEPADGYVVRTTDETSRPPFADIAAIREWCLERRGDRPLFLQINVEPAASQPTIGGARQDPYGLFVCHESAVDAFSGDLAVVPLA